MFTGIVQGKGQVIAIKEKIDEKGNPFRTHSIAFPNELLPNLEKGASVANNGCCLTVTDISADVIDFDLMNETLKLTNLGALEVGDFVNLERAAKFGDEIGGHVMSGHVTCKGEIIKIMRTECNCHIIVSFPQNLSDYILYKGFIGIDGISLTVGEVENGCFSLHLIPETLNRTTLGTKEIGDSVNLEIDPQTQAIVDTVKKIIPKFTQ